MKVLRPILCPFSRHKSVPSDGEVQPLWKYLEKEKKQLWKQSSKIPMTISWGWPYTGKVYCQVLLRANMGIIIGVLTQICLKVCPLCAWTRPLVIFFRFHMYRLNGHSWLFTTQHQWDKSYCSGKIQVEVSEITTSPLSRELIKSDIVSQGNDTSWCCTQRFKGYMYLVFKSGTENFG